MIVFSRESQESPVRLADSSSHARMPRFDAAEVSLGPQDSCSLRLTRGPACCLTHNDSLSGLWNGRRNHDLEPLDCRIAGGLTTTKIDLFSPGAQC